MLSTNYRNRIVDICCRMISTDGEVELDERIWMHKLCEKNNNEIPTVTTPNGEISETLMSGSLGDYYADKREY